MVVPKNGGAPSLQDMRALRAQLETDYFAAGADAAKGTPLYGNLQPCFLTLPCSGIPSVLCTCTARPQWDEVLRRTRSPVLESVGGVADSQPDHTMMR